MGYVVGVFLFGWLIFWVLPGIFRFLFKMLMKIQLFASIRSKVVRKLNRILDKKVKTYSIRQLIPTFLAVFAIVLHIAIFDFIRESRPRFKYTAIKELVKDQYPEMQTGVHAIKIIGESRRAYNLKQRSIENIIKSDPSRIMELLPYPVVSTQFSTEVLEMTYVLDDIEDVLKLAEAGPSKTQDVFAISQRNALLGAPPKLNYVFMCDPKHGDVCKVVLPTDIVLQNEIKIGDTTGHSLLKYPHLIALIDRSKSANSLNFKIPPPQPATMQYTRGGLVSYSYNSMYEHVDLFDMKLHTSLTPAINSQNTSPDLRLSSDTVNEVDVVLSVQKAQIDREKMLLHSCKSKVERTLDSLQTVIVDLEKKIEQLCTASPNKISPITVRRCLGDGDTIRQRDNTIIFENIDFSVCEIRQPNPKNPRSGLEKLPIRKGYVSDQSPTTFIFNREKDKAFLQILINALGAAPAENIDLEYKDYIVRQIITDYYTILGPADGLDKFFDLFPDVKLEETEQATFYTKGLKARLENDKTYKRRNAVKSALQRQPLLYPFYKYRSDLAPFVYKDLYNKLKQLGMI